MKVPIIHEFEQIGYNQAIDDVLNLQIYGDGLIKFKDIEKLKK